jgi:hypothetical protein
MRLTRTIQRLSAQARPLSTSSARAKWEGTRPQDSTTNEPDTHNVQHDASRGGKQERAAGQGSSGTSEKPGGAGKEDLNKKAEKDHPEAAKPVIGMNDERGSVSSPFF